jgi:hypothetical protein
MASIVDWMISVTDFIVHLPTFILIQLLETKACDLTKISSPDAEKRRIIRLEGLVKSLTGDLSSVLTDLLERVQGLTGVLSLAIMKILSNGKNL